MSKLVSNPFHHVESCCQVLNGLPHRTNGIVPSTNKSVLPQALGQLGNCTNFEPPLKGKWWHLRQGRELATRKTLLCEFEFGVAKNEANPTGWVCRVDGSVRYHHCFLCKWMLAAAPANKWISDEKSKKVWRVTPDQMAIMDSEMSYVEGASSKFLSNTTSRMILVLYWLSVTLLESRTMRPLFDSVFLTRTTLICYANSQELWSPYLVEIVDSVNLGALLNSVARSREWVSTTLRQISNFKCFETVF